MQKYLECGKIITTHGINGAVKTESYCDSPEVLANLPCVYVMTLGVYRALEIVSASFQGETVILTFKDIENIDKAAKLKGKTIFALRDDLKLDKDSFFVADLIGLSVIDAENGKIYGKITNVNTDTPQMLYEVETEKGTKFLPAVPAFIKKTDLEKGVFVNVIPGLLDDEDGCE